MGDPVVRVVVVNVNALLVGKWRAKGVWRKASAELAVRKVRRRVF